MTAGIQTLSWVLRKRGPMLMVDFIVEHRREIIARSRESISWRSTPSDRPTNEVPVFLNLFLSQLVKILAHPNADTEIRRTAAIHGGAMFGLGYTVACVVHDYGDIGQAITSLSIESHANLSHESLHVLGQCIEDATASAVTEFERLRDVAVARAETQRSGMLAHEIRNKLSAAQLGFQSIISGRAPIVGSVAAVVSRGFVTMSELIERTLNETRVNSGLIRPQLVHVDQFMEETLTSGKLSAEARGVILDMLPTPKGIDINADPQVLSGAVTNLLVNAFKFTPPGGKVLFRASALDRRVLIDVADACGGLPPGKSDELFDAFEQRGTDRTGLGLGLFISRKSVESSGGLIRVKNFPGVGCVFTIDLPQAVA